MLFSELAKSFDALDNTSSRLEMSSLLADMFRKLDKKDIRIVTYLCQGKLHTDFEGSELGMSDMLVLDTISSTSGESMKNVEKMMETEGDPGIIAEMLFKKKKQMTLFFTPLTLDVVIKNLRDIENSSKQSDKIRSLTTILSIATPLEAKLICRIVVGRMRVGAGNMTILDALCEAFATKEDRPVVERAFNVTCDLGLIAEILSSQGIDGIRAVKVSVGSPVKVMLAERLPSIAQVVEKMGGSCAMEYKYDGIRVQAHIGKNGVKLFSRRLEDLTSNFPDIAEALRARCKVDEAIIEGECVAIDPDSGEMLPFQSVTHRRKKHGMDKAVKEIPVRIFMFDMILCNDEDMTLKPYGERRSRLMDSFELGDMIGMTCMKEITAPEEGERFFADALADKCEGIMAKSLSENSVYRAGSRGFLWIKYKKDYEAALTDSFDLVVVGAFRGMGKRAGKYGALLMASYDEDTGTYGTVCKLGTGFDDAFLAQMPDMLDPYLSENKPTSVEAKMIPDVWFQPTVVLEVVAAEISVSPIHTAALGTFGEDSGLGLRFPRFTGRVRNDKGPDQSTTVNEICEMFDLQEKKDSRLDSY